MYFDEFNIQFNQENIFRRLQCKKETDVYEVFTEAYKKVEKKTYSKINAKSVLKFGKMPKENKNVLYVIFTVGEQVTAYAESLFEESEYVQGMLVDAMADDYLFQMDEQLKEEIKNICRRGKVHTVKRLEAPTSISIEMQKVAFDVCNAGEQLNLQINESYMFHPIKTLCIVFEIKDGLGNFTLDHECRKCDKMDCQTRDFQEVTIKVLRNEMVQIEKYHGGETLLDFLLRKEIYLPAICAGRGTCGKCKIRCIEGELERTELDEKYFTKDELEKGYRLACQAYPDSDCMIAVEENEETMEVLSSLSEEKDAVCERYGIAIDIGTTTLAMGLVCLESGDIVDHYTGVNHQRVFGADVISRIFASNNGKKQELQNIILKDLLLGIKMLTKSFSKNLIEVVISGNTTMIHLLMGYCCKGLGEYPYTAKTLDAIFLTGRQMFENICQEEKLYTKLEFPMMIFPAISAFVGGDIVSGLYYLDFRAKEETNLFIDLGTNGELVIGNKQVCLATSTAAGPAFEGGNLSCGVASIAGAIHKIDIDEKIRIQTIQDKFPIGICGTGIVDGIAELLKQGLIDETGLFIDPYFKNGYLIAKGQNNIDIKITQKDIREIQLAKAAVAAGIEIMIEEFAVTKFKINHIYIAGGFGYQLDLRKAKIVGILPSDENLKYTIIGNSSLLGGIKFLQCIEDKQKELKKIKEISTEVKEFNLADNNKFNKRYMKQMYFER